jgi:poly(3-hydroxybutyrate) depolymerase
LQHLRERLAGITTANPDLKADAGVFEKGVTWALRYDTPTQADAALVQRALARGKERAEQLAQGNAGWTEKRGRLVRGFVSEVDGSTQPYGVLVPGNYSPEKPFRLDVVLHGSSKPHGMSELRFMNRFDEGDDAQKTAPDADFIELHPLGRVENCYRWAGETDVFEAIEAACRNYNIDRDRIVLRGMSMGASGTWHLGLKHPHRFVALGPYCGYVDTHRFSETPIPGFIKVGPLPPHQELGLHMLDSVDYAANAGVVPTIAAIGGKDPFFQSHVHMGEVFAREGLSMTNLISPETAHVIDPATHRDQMQRIAAHAGRGVNRSPDKLRFVTWTLKYNRCHWVELLALARHYTRSELSAHTSGDSELSVTLATNISSFAIHRPAKKVDIQGKTVKLPAHAERDSLVFTLEEGEWRCRASVAAQVPTGKGPGIQGPIDDAFTGPFLCVRGTGTPWNRGIQEWAEAALLRFEYEWSRYMRGTLQVKNDTDVTEADLREKHLILFGDPGSNAWLAQALPQLPLKWTRERVCLGGEQGSARDHAPVLICRNPLASSRYLVVNSGHTFHEKDFAAFNYLLYPRLGDWALWRVSAGATEAQASATPPPGEVVRAGYFDEDWSRHLPPAP